MLTVESIDGSQSRGAETPRSDRTQDGVLSLVEVVSQDLLKAQVGVNDEGEGESAVEETRCAMLNAGGRDQRDETDGDHSLKRPVIRAVRRRRRRVRRRVVDCSLDVRCNREKKDPVSSAAHTGSTRSGESLTSLSVTQSGSLCRTDLSAGGCESST